MTFDLPLAAWFLAGCAGAYLLRQRGLREFPANPPLPGWLLGVFALAGPASLVAVLLLAMFDRLA